MVMVALPATAAVISCGSINGAYQYCPADTAQGVRLKQQFSSASCTPSQSWGYDRGGVWVSQGCAASFAVGPGGGQSVGVPGHDGGGAAVTWGNRQSTTTTRTITTRTVSGDQRPDPGSATESEQKIHQSRMDSIRAGMDPDTDVAAAQLRANQPPAQSASDAIGRDINKVSNAIDEDMARIETATHGPTAEPAKGSDESQREEYQANQDFQRQVMIRRANENSDAASSSSSDSSSSDSSDTTPDDTPK